MDVVQVYKALGEPHFSDLIRMISIGATKTYGVYESVKIRCRLEKLNRQKLHKSTPKLWQRILENDSGLADEITQAILVSNLTFVIEVLDLLNIPHEENGFLEKDADHADKLVTGWKANTFKHFSGKYPEPLVLLYINHLGSEMGVLEKPFTGEDTAKKPVALKSPA